MGISNKMRSIFRWFLQQEGPRKKRETELRNTAQHRPVFGSLNFISFDNHHKTQVGVNVYFSVKETS